MRLGGISVTRVLDYSLELSEFEPQTICFVHFRINNFGESYEPPYAPSYELNSITAVILQGWLRH